MLTFIDGASSTGALVASTTAATRVVGQPAGEPRDHVGGRRRDHDQVGRVGELDVTDLGLLGEVEQVVNTGRRSAPGTSAGR